MTTIPGPEIIRFHTRGRLYPAYAEFSCKSTRIMLFQPTRLGAIAKKTLPAIRSLCRKPHFRREALRSAKSRTTHKVYTDPPRSSTRESTNQTHEDIGRRCRNPLAPTANGRNGVMRSAPKRNSPGFRGPQPHENHAAPTERTAWYHKFTHTKLGDAIF